MTSSDLPEGTANDTSALSFDQGVDALADIFDAPETDLKEDKPETQASDAEPEGEQPEGEAEDELVIEDEPDSPDEADGPEEIKGGQFAPDTAKVTLADGTVISIADLKRNNLFQRDYTRKNEEFKVEKEAEYAKIEAEKQSVRVLQEQAHEVIQYRDFVLSNWQEFLGQEPELPTYDPRDPLGYTESRADYDQRLAAYNRRLGNLNQLHALQVQEGEKRAQEQSANYQQAVQREYGLLIEKLPELKDPSKREQFKAEATEALADYGFSADEVNGVLDHRVFGVVKDILRLRKALKKAPQVKEQVQQKPKLISGGKRMDPKARISRESQARHEQLRKTGSFDAGVASLMDLDL